MSKDPGKTNLPDADERSESMELRFRTQDGCIDMAITADSLDPTRSKHHRNLVRRTGMDGVAESSEGAQVSFARNPFCRSIGAIRSRSWRKPSTAYR
jgi:hypothetical protein